MVYLCVRRRANAVRMIFPMAKVSYYLDTRRLKDDGTAPLKLVIRNLGKVAQYNMNMCFLPEQWDDECSRLRDYPKHKYKEHPKKKVLNDFLEKTMLEVRTHVDMLPLKLDVKDIRDFIDRLLNRSVYEKREKEEAERKKAEDLFLARFSEFASLRNSPRTRSIYENTYNAIKRFDPKAEELAFEDVTVDWLQSFDRFLQKTSPAVNARAIHMRNIRAVFNHAIKVLEITNNYPFYKFKIRHAETMKRSLTIDQLRELFSARVYDSVRPDDAIKLHRYIDMFKLSIFLCGIRPVDLCYLRKSDVINGRIEYTSRKCGVHYSIKVEPEAWDIINQYYGRYEYLLDIFEHHQAENGYKNFLKQQNRALQNIGKQRSHLGRGGGGLVGVSLFPGISAYWARHTWATLAIELGCSMETVSAGLGHLHGEKVTLVYVAFRQKSVDEANRKVIDYVLGKKKGKKQKKKEG